MKHSHGMTGTEVVSRETLEGLRVLLGVEKGKEGGDGAVWRVRAYRTWRSRARDSTQTFWFVLPFLTHHNVCEFTQVLKRGVHRIVNSNPKQPEAPRSSCQCLCFLRRSPTRFSLRISLVDWVLRNYNIAWEISRFSLLGLSFLLFTIS